MRRFADCTLGRMNKRPGHVVVTTEVAVCTFCGRPRTLRNEQHQLGTLVRTIITCETCHRTLSSSITVASADAPSAEAAPAEGAALPAEVDAKPERVKRTATAKSKAPPATPKAAGTKSKASASRNRPAK
jgi:hypothetical protein